MAPEIANKLDLIHGTAQRAKPRESAPGPFPRALGAPLGDSYLGRITESIA